MVAPTQWPTCALNYGSGQNPGRPLNCGTAGRIGFEEHEKGKCGNKSLSPGHAPSALGLPGAAIKNHQFASLSAKKAPEIVRIGSKGIEKHKKIDARALTKAVGVCAGQPKIGFLHERSCSNWTPANDDLSQPKDHKEPAKNRA